MFILDTDHIRLIQFPESDAAKRILARLSSAGPRPVVTTIITYEEQTRGCLKSVANAKGPRQEVAAYFHLRRSLEDFHRIPLLDFDEFASSEFQRLCRLNLRVGSMDLRIAAITFVHDATLISANLRDFRKVPGLQVEDWSR